MNLTLIYPHNNGKTHSFQLELSLSLPTTQQSYRFSLQSFINPMLRGWKNQEPKFFFILIKDKYQHTSISYFSYNQDNCSLINSCSKLHPSHHFNYLFLFLLTTLPPWKVFVLEKNIYLFICTNKIQKYSYLSFKTSYI